MTLEQRVESLELNVKELESRVSNKDEQLSRLEQILRNRIDEFSAYIDTTVLSARETSR
ncbi:TPA: hypothetical protein ACF63N_000373 [Salmonella enterica]|uniref:Uncharacterized protein n=1 Tax=Salmonella virchow (strain SL491) TaxID=465517 RepID=A0A6C8ESK2_SALV4|nr:hypothetical protein FORC80_2473 [Salmonella enterica subsp. enterica serovar Virchow]EDS5417590.1 hypothetical protein [Salmonella enterica subsp. enterica serovar Oslo]EDZ00766.1 conserved hypothetical protein [Salmonella enterica subsp. enterica serovar Virchow str. SL491]EEC2400743.1 hypothetical protein [Salmonella enterica]EGS0388664.1 hypothetical protein [Salmonella enterica]